MRSWGSAFMNELIPCEWVRSGGYGSVPMRVGHYKKNHLVPLDMALLLSSVFFLISTTSMLTYVIL